MISTSYDSNRDILVCAFKGKLDSSTSETTSAQFQAAWTSAQAERTDRAGALSIVFDLAEVEFIFSAFLRLCLQAAKIAGGGSFRIINTSPAVKKLFVMAGLEQLVNG